MEAEKNLLIGKLDLEFSCDPLFRKATASFDEKGAKGLTQNVSKLSNKGLEIMFYTGDFYDKETKEGEKDLTMISQFTANALAISKEQLEKFTFEILFSKKINDHIINYKHEKLEVPFPVIELTPFAVAQSTFTRSMAKTAEVMLTESQPIEQNVAEEEQWSAKFNNEKADDEFSMFGMTGTQDTVQTLDEVNVIIKVDDIDD